MDSFGGRLRWSATLVFVVVSLAACGNGVELELSAEPTYIGPEIGDSISVLLSDSIGFDYKVNMSCTFTNVGGPGGVNVLATVSQGNESWERRASVVRAEVEQPMTSRFVFEEPTFEWGRLLVPLAMLVVPAPWSGIATAFLGEQDGSGIGATCQVYPRAADMKVRLDCIVSNMGEGRGTVAVRGSRNGIGETTELSIGPKEQKTVPFVFQVESEDDRFECHAE